MGTLEREGFRGKDLAGINWARKHQEAIFLSDIASENDSKIDSTHVGDWKFFLEGRLDRYRSYFEFGKECSIDQDWMD